MSYEYRETIKNDEYASRLDMESMLIALKTEEDLKKAKELGFVHLKPRRAYSKDYYVGLHYFRYGFKQ